MSISSNNFSLLTSSSMKTVWPFYVHAILIMFICLWFSTRVYGMQNETDRLALVAFKEGISHDALGMLSSWNDSLHFCNWSGVSCSRRHVHKVVEINLRSYGLVGFISPRIGNLTFLRTIILQNNSFHGEIPAEIGRLFRLRVLDLSNNSFGGEIPTNLTHCLNLKVLNLIDNKLKGKIPQELGSLSSLLRLGLSSNSLTGKIPASIGNLSSMVLLSLAYNSLEGSIPEGLGQLKSMEFIQLSFNKLTGTIPSSLYNLSALSYFQVVSNQLEGSINGDIGLFFPRLTLLSVSENRFTGRVPASLTNASGLEIIQLYQNSFTGTVPQDLGRLQKLRVINMSRNRISGDLSFIPSLANCTQLERMSFRNNFLKGPLVSSIANLSIQINFLDLGGNQLHGMIPSGIENLVNLSVLVIDTNLLTGSIPPTVGKLPKLQELSLEGNKLSGRIPSSLGELTLLNYLILYDNNLSGEIPPSLAACQNLFFLGLSNNNLSGSIPKELMRVSSLATLLSDHNSLSGLLPLEVGNLINLEELNVASNRLSGRIPNTLGSCLKLEVLILEDNYFEGEIPMSLHTLRGLEYLSFSHNKLSGPIPTYLGDFPFLTNLNLSFNALDGEVPTVGIFRNATIISVQGNYNLCGGIPELNLSICSTYTTEKKGKHLAVKVVIPVITAASCFSSLAVLFIIRHWKRKSRKNVSSAQLYDSQFRRISYSDLHKATGGFSESNIIGVGSYGCVYKGVLEQDRILIAVKVLNLQQKGASKSFMSECKALRKIRHRNLVKTLSACSSLDFQGNDFKALVFELMPQGSLEGWLHPEVEEDNEPKILSILQRLNVAIDVASALEYLHSHSDAIIVHSDLKPSNVLLNNDMTAHVGDFGLSKIISAVSSTTSTHPNQSSSVVVKGSVGYIAPEYGVSGMASAEGDVYSYGILLLEMFTGRRPTNDMFRDGFTLHEFVERSFAERVMEIMDPHLLFEADGRDHKLECLTSVLRIGVTCSSQSPRERMEMGDVVNKLHSIRNLFLREETSHGEGRERPDNGGEGISYL